LLPVRIDAYDHKNDRLFVGWQQAIFQPFQSSREILADHILALRSVSAACVNDLPASSAWRERQRSREARMISAADIPGG
jgi:hypothetical protein